MLRDHIGIRPTDVLTGAASNTQEDIRLCGLLTASSQPRACAQRRFDVDDQGQTAYLCVAARPGRPISTCAPGKHVGDALWVGDSIAENEAVADPHQRGNR